MKEKTVKAFLIYGPESSGNRLLHRLLIHTGCFGDGGHIQRLDKSIPPPVQNIVWGHSVPTNRVWPDIKGNIEKVKDYDVKFIIPLRDQKSMAQSQVNRKRVLDIEVANQNIILAYGYIFKQIEHLPVTSIYAFSYDAFVQYPVDVFRGMCDYFEIEWDGTFSEEIKKH